MREHKYTCYVCKIIFISESDEEAVKELEKDFPEIKVEDCEELCDDCWKKFTRRITIPKNTIPKT